ncbi:MAG: hypothetical protein FJ280_31730, partial [Planctomycetes bacterium]|nr:hypothetical protein [Planctomycetota bacterium]
MKRQGSYRMMMVWLGVVVAILMGGGGTAKADFTFGTPTNMGPTINSPQHEGTCFISGDGLEFYFSSVSIWEGGLGNWDIWVSRRADKREGWGIPTNLGPPVNSSQIDFVGSLSHDGLEMYLHSTRTGGHGKTDLYVSSRPSKDAAWTAPVNLGATFNTSSWEEKPVISSDDLELFFLSNRAGVSGGCDIYVSTRLSRSDPWGPPTNLGPTVNSSKDDILIYLSPDGLRSLLVSDRPGGFGGYDTWMSSRPSKDLPWTTPLNLGRPLNTAYADGACSVSPDGLLLYLDDWSAPRPGGFGGSDLWQVPIIPIVDFNGDGLVEIGDLVMLIE